MELKIIEIENWNKTTHVNRYKNQENTSKKNKSILHEATTTDKNVKTGLLTRFVFITKCSFSQAEIYVWYNSLKREWELVVMYGYHAHDANSFLPVLKFYITVAICFPLFQVWVTSGFGGWIWIFPSKEKSICSSKLCFKKCCFYTFWHGLKRWSVDFNEINICSFVPFGFKFWSHNLVNISKSLSLECI